MRNIRIGTRNSPLAIMQAKAVAEKLNVLGFGTEIIPIISSGDKNLIQPLYKMGITGVFTKDLDEALLNQKIDLAVHSLKDVPTKLPEGIIISAYLERDFPQDVLVKKKSAQNKDWEELKIATSSIRRRAFWNAEFPNTQFFDIRGNVQTRLEKLENQDFDATIFSLAAIKRLNLDIAFEEIPFMIPAPSQGVIAIASLEKNEKLIEILIKINHHETQICVEFERFFLQALEGGCTAPIGAFAFLQNKKIHFSGRLCSLDGKKNINHQDIIESKKNRKIEAEKIATIFLENGGKEVMFEIKKSLA